MPVAKNSVLVRRVFAVLFVAVGGAMGSARAQEAPRAARSVHLFYPAQNADAFYLESKVEKSVPGSYFMACGFRHGYFGIQEKGDGAKVVLFSVWDPTVGDHADAVPAEQRVNVLFQAPDVLVRRFGGEGTGAQCFFDHNWKTGKTYRFLIRATKNGPKTAFAAWFRSPDMKTWKHLATFQTTTGGDTLSGLYSFIEDFRRDGQSARETRRAAFGNGWLRNVSKGWQPITQARFTASDSPWEARETIDGGTAADRFYLQTGGDTKTLSPLGTAFTLPRKNRTPPRGLPE